MTNLFNDVIKSIKSPRGEASLILKAFSKIEYGEIPSTPLCWTKS